MQLVSGIERAAAALPTGSDPRTIIIRALLIAVVDA